MIYTDTINASNTNRISLESAYDDMFAEVSESLFDDDDLLVGDDTTVQSSFFAPLTTTSRSPTAVVNHLPSDGMAETASSPSAAICTKGDGLPFSSSGSLLSTLMYQSQQSTTFTTKPSSMKMTMMMSKKAQEAVDQSSSASSPYKTPGPAPHDIVCGRGMFMYHHPGSVRFRQFVEKAMPYYEVANSRSLKSIVIDLVLDQIGGGECRDVDVRFLKYDSRTKTWSELSKVQIRDKIGHALRDCVVDMQRSRQQGPRSMIAIARDLVENKKKQQHQQQKSSNYSAPTV